MPVFRGTMFLRSGDQGWTEGYFLDQPDHDGARNALGILALRRTHILSTDAHIQAVRVSNIDSPRDSLLTRYTEGATPERQGDYGGGIDPEPCNQPSDAAIIELVSTPARKGRIYLRGIPDALIASGAFTPDAEWLAAFNTLAASWGATIRDGSFRVRTKDPAGGAFFSVITQVNLMGLTTRRTGRPFGLRRGRRGTRASAPTPAG